KGKKIYLLFSAAFHSLTHKHADDLSFLLSINNTDFFVDSGKYNYKEKDPFRKYFRSTYAHNTITVGRKSYELTRSNIGKSTIDYSGFSSDYSYVSAVHTFYPGVIVRRIIVYLRTSDSIIIYDELDSEKLQTYSQIFNIGKDVGVTISTKNKIMLKSKLDNTTIEMLQLNPITEFKNYNGNSDPIYGWQSSAFNKKHPITQLQFSNKASNGNYKTVINTNPTIGVQTFKVVKQENVGY